MRPIDLVPVLIVALICGTIIGSLVLTLGLVLHGFIVWFLAFGAGAVFAAIGASWVGTLLASDHTRTRLLCIVGVTEAIAAVVAVIGFLLLRIPAVGSSIFGQILDLSLLLGMVIVALAASWATGHLRGPRLHLGRDVLTTLGLVGLSMLGVVGTLYVANLFGLAGA